MLMYAIAAAVTVLTFGAIVKKLEVRLALLTGGLIMAVIAWNPQAWSDAFARNMVVAGLLQAIPPVMGFAAVMELTGCNAHLVKMLTDPLVKVRPLLIPGAMLVTFFVNMALPSAAGCTAAVGVVLIPAMMAAGIHPAMAAAAVFAGTWGSTWSPGNAHNAMVAKIANVPVMEVIQAHMPYTPVHRRADRHRPVPGGKALQAGQGLDAGEGRLQPGPDRQDGARRPWSG